MQLKQEGRSASGKCANIFCSICSISCPRDIANFVLFYRAEYEILLPLLPNVGYENATNILQQ